MLLCKKSGTVLVAHFSMLSANSTITDIGRTSMLLLIPQVLLNMIATKQLHLLAKLISAILDFL